jgi:hypothetical protein
VKLAAMRRSTGCELKSWQLVASSNALLQLNILQTVVFSDHNTRSVQGAVADRL